MAPRTIRSLRKKLGVTQKQFAKKIGYNKLTVSFWERGTLKPGPRAVQAMKYWA